MSLEAGKMPAVWKIRWKKGCDDNFLHQDDDRITLSTEQRLPFDEPFDEKDFYGTLKAPEHMDSATFESYFDRVWEHPGMLFDNVCDETFEDGAVVDGSKALYRREDSSELRKFIQQRGLVDPYPRGLTLKFFYVRALLTADKVRRFRLMDLPLEVRGLIYQQLLRLHHSDKLRDGEQPLVADINILQASRRINEEATPFLYSNQIKIIGEFKRENEDGSGVFHAKCAVHDILGTSLCKHGRFTRVPYGIDEFPDFLRRIHNLHVEVSARLEPAKSRSRDAALEATNGLLLNLSSFLMDGHRLRKLTIAMDLKNSVTMSQIARMLYPLRRLRNVTSIAIQSAGERAIPSHLVQKLKADMESNEPTFNTVRHFKLLQDEVDAYHDLTTSANELYGTESHPSETFGLDSFDYVLYRISDVLDTAFMSTDLEEEFQARLSQLKDVLRQCDPSTVVKKLDAVAKAQKATEAYNQVSDSGKLDESKKNWGRLVDYVDEGTLLTRGPEPYAWSDDEDSPNPKTTRSDRMQMALDFWEEKLEAIREFEDFSSP